MNILLSVYACSPYDGSERAVGWNWVCELDNHHKVTALTSHVYKKDIEDYKLKNPEALPNTKFTYVKVPEWYTSWHIGYKGERLYYMLWQREASKIAIKLNDKFHYDLVHHVTYVTCVLPTYMHKLNIPFLYGPVAGGDSIPRVIRYPIGIKGYIFERVRSLSQIFFKSTYNFKKTINSANLILAATEETKDMISSQYQDKIEIFQAIGLKRNFFYPDPPSKRNKVCRILLAGRMLRLKGFELGIKSFIKSLEKCNSVELTILGDGDHKHINYLKQLCGIHLGNQIKFIRSVEYTNMKNFYDEFDILLNCSLRDSGCFVIMEAMSRGLPVICVNTGGPKVNTTNATGFKIEPEPLELMILKMSESIVELVNNKELREQMGSEARKYAFENFTMESRTRDMNDFYCKIMSQNSEV